MFGPGDTIVEDGYSRVMWVTETGIAENDVADIVDVEIVEVAGVAELVADGTKFSKTEIRSKRGWSEV